MPKEKEIIWRDISKKHCYHLKREIFRQSLICSKCGIELAFLPKEIARRWKNNPLVNLLKLPRHS